MQATSQRLHITKIVGLKHALIYTRDVSCYHTVAISYRWLFKFIKLDKVKNSVSQWQWPHLRNLVAVFNNSYRTFLSSQKIPLGNATYGH